jgi:hypothetical protein
MNWWAVVIIAFAVALLPWQIFRYARRRNDSVPKHVVATKVQKSDDSSSW